MSTTTQTYAVFFIRGAREFAAWEFFGLWVGENAADAIERSNISRGHGDATEVGTIPWKDVTVFSRTGWVQEG